MICRAFCWDPHNGKLKAEHDFPYCIPSDYWSASDSLTLGNRLLAFSLIRLRWLCYFPFVGRKLLLRYSPVCWMHFMYSDKCSSLKMNQGMRLESLNNKINVTCAKYCSLQQAFWLSCIFYSDTNSNYSVMPLACSFCLEKDFMVLL